jgi:adenylate cyclase
VREQQLTPGIDGGIEDLGDRCRKQARDPVRGYRVGPRGPRPIIGAGFFPREIYPSRSRPSQ